MIRFMPQFRTFISVCLLCALEWGVCLQAQAPTLPSVMLSPGDNIQAAVTAAPAETTFMLLPGVYRMQSIQPLNGDAFIGQGSVVLNGSQILAFQLDPAGSGLWVANATASPINQGECQSAFPLCGYTQDLFIDNVLQAPVSSPEGMKQGAWYFDRNNDLVFIPGNPAGHSVELGMKQVLW